MNQADVLLRNSDFAYLEFCKACLVLKTAEKAVAETRTNDENLRKAVATIEAAEAAIAEAARATEAQVEPEVEPETFEATSSQAY